MEMEFIIVYKLGSIEDKDHPGKRQLQETVDPGRENAAQPIKQQCKGSAVAQGGQYALRPEELGGLQPHHNLAIQQVEKKEQQQPGTGKALLTQIMELMAEFFKAADNARLHGASFPIRRSLL